MVSQSVSVRFLCLFGCFHISRMWQKAVLVRFVDRMRTVSFLASTFIGRLAWKVSCDWWWGAGRWNHSQLFHTWVSPLWGQHEQMLWRRTFCLLPGHWRTLRKVPVVIIIITLTTNDYILLYHTKDKYIQQDVRKQQLLLCVVLQSHFVPAMERRPMRKRSWMYYKNCMWCCHSAATLIFFLWPPILLQWKIPWSPKTFFPQTAIIKERAVKLDSSALQLNLSSTENMVDFWYLYCIILTNNKSHGLFYQRVSPPLICHPVLIILPWLGGGEQCQQDWKHRCKKKMLSG